MPPAFLLALIFAAAEAATTAVLDDLVAAVEFCRSPPVMTTGSVLSARLLVKFFSNSVCMNCSHQLDEVNSIPEIGAIPGCGSENEIGEDELFGRRERLRRSAFVPYQTGKALSEQVSGTLDKVLLFSGYDKQIRPGVS